MASFTRRQLGLLGGGLSVGLLMSGCSTAAMVKKKTNVLIDPLNYVDPELRSIARQMLEGSGSNVINAGNLQELRPLGQNYAPPILKSVPYVKRIVPSSKGLPEVTVFVINADKKGKSRPAILHTHGGGYILGAAKWEIGHLQKIAKELDCVIVTVEYRLAPEYRYSDSVEDNYAGLKWLHTNASELGVDVNRIAVMGESAGGGHAALLAITARDRGEIPLAMQVLIYPMLDDRTGSSRSVPSFIGAIGWTAESNRFGWRSFLGREPGGADGYTGGVPARVENLEGLAPAFIGVGAVDLFVDEDIEYARRLVSAGVPTELVVVPGAFHGFDHASDTSIAKRFTKAKLNSLRRTFGQKIQN
ncbi:MAG: alpha/beta hydrolase [Alphaproteobacteria bacterium]|nr:MAG: alpha/beta hydrolase [Alphaproteobacteria bacterium]